jgi:hypothetical protein
MMRKFLTLAILLSSIPAIAQTYGRMDFSLQNAQGQAIAGATVTVQTQTGGCGGAASTNATLYPSSAGGTPLVQPLHTDGFGHIYAYTASSCYTVSYDSPSTGILTFADQFVFVPGGVYCSLNGCTLTGPLIGTSAKFSDPGLFNNTPGVTQRNVFNTNNANTATLFGQTGNGIDALTAGINIPAQTSGNYVYQANAFGSYVAQNSPYTAGVAGYFVCWDFTTQVAANGSCWSLNTISATTLGHPATVIALEGDFQVYNAGDSAYGINLQGGGSGVPSVSNAYRIGQLGWVGGISGGTPIPWSFGFVSSDGAASNHYIGALASVSAGSQPIQFGSRNSGGGLLVSALYTDVGGDIIISPSSSSQSLIDTGNLTVQHNATISGNSTTTGIQTAAYVYISGLNNGGLQNSGANQLDIRDGTGGGRFINNADTATLGTWDDAGALFTWNGGYANSHGTLLPTGATGNTGRSTGLVSLVPGAEAFGIAVLGSGVSSTISDAAACTPSATCVYKLSNCGVNGSTALGVYGVTNVSAGTSFKITSFTAGAVTTQTGDGSSICWQIN